MTTPTPNLLIIDGFNILYRAFHGNENLTGPNGQPTGAIHGFLRTLTSVQRLFPGYQTVITLDPFSAEAQSEFKVGSSSKNVQIQQLADLGTSEPTRRDILPSYKGTRSAMPNDLRSQLLPLVIILQAQGYPMLQGNDFAEADDLLATLATLTVKRGGKAAVCSGDKDTFALIKDGSVCVYNPNTNKIMDEQAVIDKFGVDPSKVEDFLALMGDAVDNIPGVKKCGEKTAAKWLNAYGDLNGVIAHAAEVKGVVGENLRAALATLPIAKSLTALKKNLPINLDDSVKPQPQNTELLKLMYESLGMKSALTKLTESLAPAP